MTGLYFEELTVGKVTRRWMLRSASFRHVRTRKPREWCMNTQASMARAGSAT